MMQDDVQLGNCNLESEIHQLPESPEGESEIDDRQGTLSSILQ